MVNYFEKFTMRKFPIIMRNLEKCPECLRRFHVGWAREILSKRNFLDFESPEKDGKNIIIVSISINHFIFIVTRIKIIFSFYPFLIVYNPKVTNKMDEKCLKTSNFLEQNYKARHAFF
jgi:hypothetical protein